MVLRQRAVLTATGAAFGLVGELAAGRLPRGLLFGVAPTDPFVLVAVAPVLALVEPLEVPRGD